MIPLLYEVGSQGCFADVKMGIGISGGLRIMWPRILRRR